MDGRIDVTMHTYPHAGCIDDSWQLVAHRLPDLTWRTILAHGVHQPTVLAPVTSLHAEVVMMMMMME